MNNTLFHLRRLAKKASRIYMHCERDPLAPSYSTKSIFVVQFIGLNDKKLGKVAMWGTIGNGWDDSIEEYKYEYRKCIRYSNHYSPKQGFWSLWNTDAFRTAVGAMPRDQEPELAVRLDAFTTQNHMAVRFHADALYLRTNDECYQVLLDVSCGPHNTARFGSPGSTFASPAGDIIRDVDDAFLAAGRERSGYLHTLLSKGDAQ